MHHGVPSAIHRNSSRSLWPQRRLLLPGGSATTNVRPRASAEAAGVAGAAAAGAKTLSLILPHTVARTLANSWLAAIELDDITAKGHTGLLQGAT